MRVRDKKKKVYSLYYVHACMGVALCTRTDLYPRVDLYLHTSEKMIGGAYLFSLVSFFLSVLSVCPSSLSVDLMPTCKIKRKWLNFC